MRSFKKWTWLAICAVYYMVKMRVLLLPPFVIPVCPDSHRVDGRACYFWILIPVWKEHSANRWEHIMLHEFRHIWQFQHHPKTFFRWVSVNAKLDLPWAKRGTEIDAEAFAKSGGKHGDMQAFTQFPSKR